MLVVVNLFDIIPGREKDYTEYLRRVQPILKRYGAEVLQYGQTRMVYMGNCTQEYCGLVAYPDAKSLGKFSHDAEFKAIRPLRDDSTTNYVLTVIDRFDTLDDAIEYLDQVGE